jgi:hypothetical protein
MRRGLASRLRALRARRRTTGEVAATPSAEGAGAAQAPVAKPDPERNPEPEAGVATLPGFEPAPTAQPDSDAARAAGEPRVTGLTAKSLHVPQRWNLWELERVAREQSGGDAIRDEERSFLLMYLREFADADGALPTSFDGVVREAFGDALDAVRA